MKNLLINLLRRTPFYGLAAGFYHGLQRMRLRKAIEAGQKRLESLPVKKILKNKGEPLNIVQLSSSDNMGGAALVAFRLHKAYGPLGHNPMMLVGKKLSEDKKVISISDTGDDPFAGLCAIEGLQYWSCLSSFDIPMREEFNEADLFHCHNLHGNYFNYFALPGLTRLKPSVWTLHDMQALTGHCAFSLDCARWETGCGDCPMLDAYPHLEKDTTRLLWEEKKEVFSKSNIEIVVPSKWLYDIVKKSILANKNVHLIYNGIDTGVFHPSDKREARDEFNIPPEKLVLITSASGGIKNPQKGGEFLLEALRKISHRKDIVVVSVGDKDYDPEIKGIEWINTGHIFDENEVAKWYSAADLLLYPSLADNCPLVILEALACALPVVTFSTGGIPELVRHMETGYIAEYKNTEQFVKGIELFLDDKGLRERAGKEARKDVEKSFTLDKMAAAYLELYYDVIERRSC
ncbi:MAG: glycosyltransferase family 4 protein [Thermodesulfobacteriota bacterium]